MTDEKIEKLANEYAALSVPFECDDSEGMYVEEVYPAQIRSVAELGFIAGYRARDAEIVKLREALEQVKDKTVTDPAHEVELRARAAFVYKIVVEALK